MITGSISKNSKHLIRIALIVTKTDDNTWNIKNAKSLAKNTYLVNDTFDTEKVAVLVKMIFFTSRNY
jgi:hypothetical protein